MAKNNVDQSKSANDQRSDSLNPNNPKYYKERGLPVPSKLPSGPKPKGK